MKVIFPSSDSFVYHFTVLWIAYSFYAAPLIASLAKINVAAGGGKDFP